MIISNEQFFCEKLDTSIPELSDIGETFRSRGLEAAEKQLCDYVRKAAQPEKYFRLGYSNGRENPYAYPHETDVEIADRVMRGEIMSVGIMKKFEDGKINWLWDPTPGQYNEWIFQFSRHHEFKHIAHAFVETGDEKYVKGFSDLFMSWYEQSNPEITGSGANMCWRTIEVGIRTRSNWSYAFHVFYKHLSDHVLSTFIKSTWDNGNRVREHFSSGNWLMMEMAGLSTIGMVHRWFKDADEWVEFAFNTLANSVESQTFPDGFQYELTSNYHPLVIGQLTLVIDVAKALEFNAPSRLLDLVKMLNELYLNLCTPDRRLPAINDGFRHSGLAAALKYAPEREDYRYVLTDGKEGKRPDFTSVVLPYSGIATMRTGWKRDDIWFFMESGPFGLGQFQHQHEDKLNVLMYAYGKNVLRDTGNHAYNCTPMHVFAKDTPAHNCAMVDDCAQNRRAKYKFLKDDPRIYDLSNIKWGFTTEADTVEGYYDEGYGPEFIDVTHKRKAIFFKKGVGGSLPFAAIIDRLTPNDNKEHKYAVSYQMDIQPYTVDGNTFTADFGDNVTFSIISSETPEIIKGQLEPYIMGWRPKSFTETQSYFEVPCVRYPYFGKEQRLVTLLYPSNNGEVVIKSVSAKNDVNDTEFTLTFTDGKQITINEKDYPCIENAPVKFLNEDVTE